MKDPRVYLAQMLERIQRIEVFTRGGKEVFLDQELVQDGVIRNLEVLGEAVKRVPQSYREQHPEIAWRMMAGLRDVLIHDYEGVDLERVWRIVQNDLPPLKQAIQAILPPLEQLERELAGENDDGPVD
jgi:uncharacterized protein with HEPN domain